MKKARQLNSEPVQKVGAVFLKPPQGSESKPCTDLKSAFSRRSGAVLEKPPLLIGLPPEAAELLSKTPPTRDIAAGLALKSASLDRDPEFLAAYLKARFVEDVLQAMEHTGLSKSQVAQRLGKSRQYVGRVLNERANFTIETMVEIACALGMTLGVQLRPARAPAPKRPRVSATPRKLKALEPTAHRGKHAAISSNG